MAKPTRFNIVTGDGKQFAGESNAFIAFYQVERGSICVVSGGRLDTAELFAAALHTARELHLTQEITALFTLMRIDSSTTPL